MCGICGFAGFGDKGLLERMCATLAHRGPDDTGTLIDRQRRVFLGHTRLSIIDLESGHQPILNEDKTVAVILNGEIYNFQDLRKHLQQKSHVFRTHSDTEVLVHLYEEYGDEMADWLHGIFAFVLYDKPRQRLFGVRDHFGVKPLYYICQDQRFLFASEIKAILACQEIPRTLNFEALHYALNLRYVPGKLTYFNGMYQLPAGHHIVYDVLSSQVTIRQYHRHTYQVDSTMSEDDAVEGIRFYVKQAVKRQLVSDVPLGAYLSGGLDSSSIVAYASEFQPGIKTFSMGFHEPTDEVADARKVSTHFQTQFHETFLNLNPLAALRDVVWHVEEPKVNMLQGYFLSQFARQHVKVVLSGLGGDELFAGYMNNRLLYPLQFLHRLLPRHGASRHLARLVFLLGQRIDDLRLDEYRRGLQMLFSYGNKTHFYSILRNVWDDDDEVYDNVYAPEFRERMRRYHTRELFEHYFEETRKSIVEQSLWAEFNTKLVDDFLLNEDRTSMAHGLEVRVPFLDRDLVRFAFSIPYRFKIRRNITKYIYKKAMRGILPDWVIAKKKWGFAINPYYQFQKDLKQAALDVLTEKRITEQGIFNYAYIHKILHHPISPRLRWHYMYLWQLVGFQLWYELFIEQRSL